MSDLKSSFSYNLINEEKRKKELELSLKGKHFKRNQFFIIEISCLLD